MREQNAKDNVITRGEQEEASEREAEMSDARAREDAVRLELTEARAEVDRMYARPFVLKWRHTFVASRSSLRAEEEERKRGAARREEQVRCGVLPSATPLGTALLAACYHALIPNRPVTSERRLHPAASLSHAICYQ
eukprot:1657453-Rhodomonas_salina.1